MRRIIGKVILKYKEKMRKPLMPKATASWLIENTTLSFRQISEFVELHTLEFKQTDDEVSSGILPRNPIEHGELTYEEIKNCEKDESKNLKIKVSDIPIPVKKTKGARYTPLSKELISQMEYIGL